jgi:GTPase SAR1 family protein
MKKIAIVGPHGQGKTTFCFNLCDKLKKDGYNVELLQEQARFAPFGINEEMTIETSYWILTNQIRLELEASNRKLDYLICDRTPLDTFLYAEHFKLDNHYMNKSFRNLAEEWLQTYHKIFLLIRMENIIKEDNVRSTDKSFVIAMKDLFKQNFPNHRAKAILFNDYQTLENIKVT